MKIVSETPGISPGTTRAAMPWLMWSAAALFFAYGFFARVAPSVMVEDLMRDFQATGAVVGNISAFYFYAYASLQVPIGIGLDRFGPRLMLTLAALVCGLGVILFGIAETLTLAYIGRLLIGAGSACAMIGTLKIASIWFPANRFSLIFGLTVIIGAVGAVGGQAPLAALFQWMDWRSVHVIGGLAAVLLALFIWGVVRDAPAPALPQTAKQPVLRGLGFIMRTPQIWIIALVNATMVAPLLAFGGLWGVPYMMATYDLGRPSAALAASMMLVGHAALSAVLGWFSDRTRRRKPVLVACTIISLISFASLLYVPGLPLPMAYVCLLAYGAFSGASSVCYATAKENNPIRYTGVTAGFVNMTTMGLSAMFQAVLGWLLDVQWDGTLAAGARIYSVDTYRTALSALVVTSAIAVVLVFFVRETNCKSRD